MSATMGNIPNWNERLYHVTGHICRHSLIAWSKTNRQVDRFLKKWNQCTRTSSSLWKKGTELSTTWTCDTNSEQRDWLLNLQKTNLQGCYYPKGLFPLFKAKNGIHENYCHRAISKKEKRNPSYKTESENKWIPAKIGGKSYRERIGIEEQA